MIDIEKVKKGLECCSNTGKGRCEKSECPYWTDSICCIDEMQSDALELLKEQETVEHACDILRANGWKETEPLCSECDAVHVVRCKDCKHWYFADNRIPCEQENVCGRNGIVVTPDWFCADGERRETDA